MPYVTTVLKRAIDALTPEQRAAVEHDGNASLLARPGSGKTRVVGLRLARGAVARRRVAVTSYTNVAVNEVHEVVKNAGITLGSTHFVGTLHSFLLDYVVRPHGHLVVDSRRDLRLRHDDWGHGSRGPKWPEVVLDEDGRERVPVSYFDWQLDGTVVCRRRPEWFRFRSTEWITERGAADARAKKIQCIKRRGIMSQADAMFVAWRLLRRHERLATALAGRFDELIVDEAQDTSDVQLACLRLIRDTRALRSLVLVADLEQSIYGFQGADPTGCQRLIADCALEPLDITRNFRSSQRICDVAQHFTSRETADEAVGEHAACEIDPEVLRFDARRPETAVDTFSQRLRLHGVSETDVAVLTRTRGLRDKLNGEAGIRFNRLTRIIGGLAGARRLRRTLRADEIVRAEEALLWCVTDSAHLRDLTPAERRRVRATVARLLTELPALDGTMAQWVSATRPVVTEAVAELADGRPLAHRPSDALKTRKEFETIKAAEAFGTERPALYAQTVHAVKGRSVDAVLLVVEERSKRGVPAQLLTDLGSGGDLREREVVRIGFVALTRARRYCAVALTDSVPEDVHARYVSMGFAPV
ncbi:MAG TPA: ATP-dependent helicase [Conexibacter sp.]|nr:ATP-dependent helicase [Conexibacter sp.]